MGPCKPHNFFWKGPREPRSLRIQFGSLRTYYLWLVSNSRSLRIQIRESFWTSSRLLLIQSSEPLWTQYLTGILFRSFQIDNGMPICLVVSPLGFDSSGGFVDNHWRESTREERHRVIELTRLHCFVSFKFSEYWYSTSWMLRRCLDSSPLWISLFFCLHSILLPSISQTWHLLCFFFFTFTQGSFPFLISRIC